SRPRTVRHDLRPLLVAPPRGKPVVAGPERAAAEARSRADRSPARPGAEPNDIARPAQSPRHGEPDRALARHRFFGHDRDRTRRGRTLSRAFAMVTGGAPEPALPLLARGVTARCAGDLEEIAGHARRACRAHSPRPPHQAPAACDPL